MLPALITITPIAPSFSAITSTALPALAFLAFAKAETSEKTETKKNENNELLTGKEFAFLYGSLNHFYRIKSKQLKYDDFKIHESMSLDPKILLYYVGSNINSNSGVHDPFHNTPLTRLVANQRFGLVKSIMNVVGDQELLKANPDLTKRFLDSFDDKGINFLEISSRFYGVMPKELLEKVVSLYDKNAEPESIKLTPAILSLPNDLFDSLLPKIDKKNIEEFTNPNIPEREIYEKIVASRKEVGLSPLVIYVEKGYENSVLVNYNPKNDGLPDQGQRKITDDNFFEFQDLRTGTIASKKLAKMGEEIIREKFTRNDLSEEDKDSIINALINKNPTATRMAKKNAESNLSRLKLDVCPSTKPNSIGGQPMDYSKIANSKIVEGVLT